MPAPPHQIGIVQVDGISSGATNPCLGQEAQWAGGGLNLYTFLTYGTSSNAEPGCNDPGGACNAGYQAGINAFNDAVAAGVNAGVPWWLTSRIPRPTCPSGRRTPSSTRTSSRAHSTRSTRPRASATSASTPAPASGTSILGTYSPSVPYWMADYLSNPSGPGSCADYQNWVVNHGAHLPGPPSIVQYNSTQFDDDYAC